MLLVDADNVSADVIDQAVERVMADHGAIHVRRAYCTAESALSNLQLFKRHSIRPIVNLSTGKNSTDIALAVDAMDLVMAENGLEAVEAMGRDQFDLVLMDVQMPVMDGLTATRAIRALPTVQARMTPIIAMTANVLPDHVKRCLEAGMDDHIGKPISPASLLGALSRWSLGREAGAMADRENVA